MTSNEPCGEQRDMRATDCTMDEDLHSQGSSHRTSKTMIGMLSRNLPPEAGRYSARRYVPPNLWANIESFLTSA